MSSSLNLTLELTSEVSEEKCRLLTRHINAALSKSSELNGLVKNVSISISTPVSKFSPYEVGQAGGRARAARLTAKERTAIAKRAALARWKDK